MTHPRRNSFGRIITDKRSIYSEGRSLREMDIIHEEKMKREMRREKCRKLSPKEVDKLRGVYTPPLTKEELDSRKSFYYRKEGAIE